MTIREISNRNIQLLFKAVLLQGIKDALLNRPTYKVYSVGGYGNRKHYGYISGKYQQLSDNQRADLMKITRNIDDARNWFDVNNKDFEFVCNAAGYDSQTVVSRLNKYMSKIIEDDKNVRR